MKLTFFGGVGEATGANYILESTATKPAGADAPPRIMIDCGLHQGSHYATKENFEPFPYDPKTDRRSFHHTRAPRSHRPLAESRERPGFTGKIYSTPATKDFAELMLLDSEHILDKEAEREHQSPLYDATDDIAHVALWHGLDYHQQVTVGHFTIEPFDAGHILGSAIHQNQWKAARRSSSPATSAISRRSIIKPTEMIDTVANDPRTVDYCVIESTYGDRMHENVDQRREDA